MKYPKKLFSISLLIISFLLFFYTFYKSEIIFNSNKFDYYLTYYLLSLILFFFSIISFYFSEKIKEYFVIIITSIVFSLYLFEASLIFKDKFTFKEKIYKNKTGKEFDKRTLFQIYSDLNEIENFVIPIRPNTYLKNSRQLFPLSGLSDSKTILCNENGYYAIYKSDRFGFNNNDQEWNNKKFEYVLIGDSFAQGECVNRENNIASVLKKLTNKSVINLGYGGNGPLINYATLKEYITPNIKNILWIYYEGNDLSDLEKELKNSILRKYLYEKDFNQNLKEKQKNVNILNNELLINAINNKTNMSFNFFEFLKLNLTRSTIYAFIPSKYNPQYNLIPEFKKILVMADKLAKSNKSEFHFIYLPSYKRYKFNKNFAYKNVKEIVLNLDINFIDIHSEVFKKTDDPLSYFPFGLNGHYTIEGYKKVAEIIYENISQ